MVIETVKHVGLWMLTFRLQKVNHSGGAIVFEVKQFERHTGVTHEESDIDNEPDENECSEEMGPGI